ncbi:C39 family peptidase [Cohnella sp. GCM10020058]|uniref:C39 family peptidase n=1 Tax=Cohnella sp. GCM10020058 TaxID=3317330 RepID=UPI00362BE40D
MTVYYSQEDKRWASVPYTRRGDPTQTIGSSACGPTSFAMVASTYKGRPILPPETAAWAVERGYRTANSGTAWSYFDAIARNYGLMSKQTGSLSDVKAALAAGALVIATMGPGHLTGGGHYVLMVGIDGKWIEVYDPNHDNTKYGKDGLIDQGVKDDGKIRAHESVFATEARQYWIFPQQIKNEEDEPMTKEERAEFETLQKLNKEQAAQIKALADRLASVENLQIVAEPPAWAAAAVQSAVKSKLIDTPSGGSYDFYRLLTVLYRKGII